MKRKLYIPKLALFGFLTLSSNVYTELNYSGVLGTTGPHFEIDLNDDGVIDAEFDYYFSAGGSGVWSSGYGAMNTYLRQTRFICNTYSLGSGGLYPDYEAPLPKRTLVSSELPSTNLLWQGSSNHWMLWTTSDINNHTQTFDGPYSPWNALSNMFVGVEVTVSNNLYYGYIQFSVDAENNITLVDHAIEQEPNTWIFCGATPSNNFTTLSNIEVNSGQLSLTANLLNAGNNYSLQRSTNLNSQSDWIDIEAIEATSYSTNFTDNYADRESAFYRLIEM